MSSPNRLTQRVIRIAAVAAVFALTGFLASAELPPWLQHVVGASSIEAALYRMMSLPSVQMLYPRPAKESQAELARLIAAEPGQAELYSLRAHSDEDALDFNAAEADWKLFATHSSDREAAKLDLAAFYHRRLMIAQELPVLDEIAAAPALAAERFRAPPQQRSWQTYQRLLGIAREQGLPMAQVHTIYDAFLTRYPDQPAVYAGYLEFLLGERDYTAAETLIARYQKTLPTDPVFPIRARALLEYRRGNIDKALAIYDQSFQPLWPADLVQSYFALLAETHRERRFVADARGRLAQHPDGPEALNAVARIFLFQQQQGRLDGAQQTLDSFRTAREQHQGTWSATDLYTLATLSESIHSYSEVARYDYALASSSGTLANGESAEQAGLSGLVQVLLTAPDQPMALGAGNLTLYRDIATLDQGPGYWNGVLSLWLNGTSPEDEYNTETAKAQSYFHRAKAAELLARLDATFPAAPERPALHVALIHAYAGYGESKAVIAAGAQFLSAFPVSPDRMEIIGLMADAYAGQHDTAAEFALYDATLTALAERLKQKTGGLPLSASGQSGASAQSSAAAAASPQSTDVQSNATGDTTLTITPGKPPLLNLGVYTPTAPIVPEAVDYARILDRYIGRLTAEKHLPQALAVLRRQLDLYPDDPLLYERLATFLEQNKLDASLEELYGLAISHFQQPGWYDKLARLYLRERKREAYSKLSHQVVDTFSGTDLEAYFRQVPRAGTGAFGAQLALELNLYAAKRFPHDTAFTRNLLTLYAVKPTANAAALQDLLRHHWWESSEFRDRFFGYLSVNNKLESELTQLQTQTATPEQNPASARELAEASIWMSHFEQAAPPLSQLANLYPADVEIGDRAVSIFRSLAYLDQAHTSLDRAVAIEKSLSLQDPADANRLATLGDLYAEASANGGEDIVSAAPYWRRIPSIHPGTPAGFLTSATIFWDYFQFDDALTEIHTAREHFGPATLYGFEAGAIQENRLDLPAAIDEYTAATVRPAGLDTQVQLVWATIDAWEKPPSDAADSNLRSTAQAMCGSCESRDRLLQLARRPASRVLIDQASARALTRNPDSQYALTLRADILNAQHRDLEIPPLLEHALAQATTAAQAANIGQLAQARELTPVYEHSVSREIALTTDPLERIRLNVTLVLSLESHKDISAATKVMDGVYRANPRVLGVVRTATDFYLRTQQPQRAIATLLEAAKVANPALSRSFMIEAAQHANDAGDPAEARRLALALLPATPYDAQLLSIVAASYARTNDDQGLKQFYETQLDAVRTGQVTPEERKADTALLRRGLIPALTRLKDFAGALNQYIALLSAYPEDSSTAQQAALYALEHSLQPQLLEFLRSTVKQSPRDSRFAILLAQTEATFEDLPAAAAAYSQAIGIRKDRVDLYEARADLELRLGLTDPARLESAAADFERLYLLSYKDPSWKVRLAELRVRQQRPADAVRALEAAYIAGRPASPQSCFQVAAQLEQWSLLTEAGTFAQQGVTLAAENLLIPRNTFGNEPGAVLYARIFTRLGRADQVLATLTNARRTVDEAADAAEHSALAAEIAASGVSQSDAAAFRKNFLDQRRQLADTQLDQAIAAMGMAVQTFYTPEQKLALAHTLNQLHETDPKLALTAVTRAGLTDREAAWRRQMLLTGTVSAQGENQGAFSLLERHRLAFAELAQTLEAFAARPRAPLRSSVLQASAQAWHDAGDEANELRVLRQVAKANDAAALSDRFFDLLLRHDPAALSALSASNNTTLADAAANYVIANGSLEQAASSIASRGKTLPPVWSSANLSLAGMYLSVRQPDGSVHLSDSIRASFTSALRPYDSISDRLGRAVDPQLSLAGDRWFFLAGRYGIVQLATRQSDAEDFLPAELEHTPTLPAGYMHLARTYSEQGAIDAALREYEHALELGPTAPSAPSIHDEIAQMLLVAGRRPQAQQQWNTALALLLTMQQHSVYPESFFADFKSVVKHIGQQGLFPTLRPQVEPILRGYLAQNGNYRSNELLEAVYHASSSATAGASSIVSLADAAANPNQILDDLRRAPWLAPQTREPILLRQIELAHKRPASDTQDASQGLAGYQTELVEFYLDQNQLERAAAVLDQLAADPRTADGAVIDRIVLTARMHRLQTMVSTWRENPASAPQPAQLDSALYHLRQPKPAYKPDPATILPLAEFVFESKQRTHLLLPTDFLVLAQSRLDVGDLPGALMLLQRLSLQPTLGFENGESNSRGSDDEGSAGELPSIQYRSTAQPHPCANIDYAASLLESTHHPAEALPFLRMLLQCEPWNSGSRLRQAQALQQSAATALAIPALRAVVSDPLAPYATRVEAAENLGQTGQTRAAVAGGTPSELSLLAGSSLSAVAVRQPYFAAARIAAAARPAALPADRDTLLREAIAITPSGAAANQARLSLLQLQSDTSNPAATIAILGGVQRASQPPVSNRAGGEASDNDADSSDAPEQASSEDDEVHMVLPPIAVMLDLDRRIQLAELLASAFERDRQPLIALGYLQLAVSLESTPAPSLLRRRDRLEAQLALDRRNAARRPVIGSELNLQVQVRRRLTLLDLQGSEGATSERALKTVAKEPR